MSWRLFTHAIVAGAVAVMIALGIWQLQRAEWKQGLLDQYSAAADQPAVAFPANGSDAPPLFRRSEVACEAPGNWRHEVGKNLAGEVGFSHIATCEGGALVDIGWSREPVAGDDWQGATVTGVIGPDKDAGFRLVADQGQAGLAASAPPSTDDVPNNHIAYAVQWFLFAGIAVIIYGLALRKRRREEAGA